MPCDLQKNAKPLASDAAVPHKLMHGPAFDNYDQMSMERMMKDLKCIFVGKLKEPWAKSACEHYAGAVKRFQQIEQVAVKDAPGSLPEKERRKQEGERILDKIEASDFVIALDEHGRSMASKKLASKLQAWIEDPGRRPCFVVGGAFGLSKAVLERSDFTMSFGPMTLPHELARVVLLEQLYRAHSILRGSPYHH